MAEHERDLCLQRPMDIKLESFMNSMERDMAAVREEFRNTLIEERETHKKEVEELKQLMAEQKKMKDEYTSQIAEMEKSLLEVKKMKEEMKSFLTSSYPLCFIEFTMTQYSTLKKNIDAWFSPPFYTGPGGYKMCISVDANGWGDGAGTHVSVYVYLMRGEYDSRLVWPFRGDITIQLVNHNNDQDHHEYTELLNDAAAAASGRVLGRERARRGWGKPQFITHNDVESSTKTRQYIVNDCLTFRITKVVVHSV